MESGPNRVNAPLGGPVIPRSRRDLFKDQSFGGCDNAGINTSLDLTIQSERAKVGSCQHSGPFLGIGLVFKNRLLFSKA